MIPIHCYKIVISSNDKKYNGGVPPVCGQSLLIVLHTIISSCVWLSLYPSHVTQTIIHTMKLVGNVMCMKVGDFPLCSPLSNSVSPFITTIITIIRSLTSGIRAFCILCTILSLAGSTYIFIGHLGVRRGISCLFFTTENTFSKFSPLSLTRVKTMVEFWNYMQGYIVDIGKVNP